LLTKGKDREIFVRQARISTALVHEIIVFARPRGHFQEIARAKMSKTRTEVRILLAGHNGLFREGLKTLLEEQPGYFVIGDALDGKDALRLVETIKPDILILETELLENSGIEFLRSLQNSEQKIRTVLLLADIKNEQAVEAFSLGARGIILKESATTSLFNCINAVMEGQYWVPGKGKSDSPVMQKHPRPSPGAKTPPAKFGLTKREMQILALAVAGKTNREIAKRVAISEQTVKHHLTNIFDKVGVYNRLELALFAIHHSLTTATKK
jgi:two-component system, NarL family, nitrate/nitrite response regulator NarL